MGEAHGWITIHFLRPPEGLCQSTVIFDQNPGQRIKQISGKPGPVRFREIEHQGFDFRERYHGGDNGPDSPSNQAALS